MKRLTLFAMFLFASTAPSWAASRSCNITLVNQAVCRASDNLVLFYDAPAFAFADLRDALVSEFNWQAEIVCAPSRQWEPLLNGNNSRVLSAAGQAEDGCPTVGQPVANPQGAAEFADAQIDSWLRNKVIAYKHNLAQQSADDITSIDDPDVGSD